MEKYLYLSQVGSRFGESDLSNSFNPGIGSEISGFICCSRSRLLFYFEGKDIETNNFLTALDADKKHEYIYKIKIPEDGKGLFSGWHTRHLSNEESRGFHREHYIEQCMLYIKNNFRKREQFYRFIWTNIKFISKEHQNSASFSGAVCITPK